ncbi:hypothetical protein KEM55_003929 [Ascosphaera atra]|nr:hypothetical protein KEM55_003929 [Ascosphaera atra]
MSSSQQPQSQQDKFASNLDLGVSIVLYNWTALSLAVQNQWGGPQSADKRDWLCGEIPEILKSRPETDEQDMEEILMHVMIDEFDVAVEDDSAEQIANQVIQVRDICLRGEFDKIKEMYEAYEKKQKKGNNIQATEQKQGSEDGGDDDDDEDDEDEDEEMTDAPTEQRPPRERIEPEVDEDGFTTVVSRRKR